jgi:hypothetical protein
MDFFITGTRKRAIFVAGKMSNYVSISFYNPFINKYIHRNITAPGKKEPVSKSGGF